MAAGLSDQQVGRLERSCTPRDWIRAASSRPGIERMEACFTRHAFAPHRHNTYAIGITLQGVQAFGYRGVARRSTSGQVFVLHPDELHDGRAGTEAGYRYRILYVEPHLIGEALGGPGTLPFVCDPISENPRLAAAIRPALADLNLSLEDLQQDQIVADLAQALAAADRLVPRKAPYTMDRPAMGRAREYLDARFEQPVRSAELEMVTELDRYALARQFRRCFGTSPYCYLMMRRLDRARGLIAAGTPLCEVALAAGFADQSHLTRHFKRTYGLPPGRWAALMRPAPGAPPAAATDWRRPARSSRH